MLKTISTLALRFLVALQTTLDRALDSLVARAQVAPQAGQGTVEYVGIILLLAGVLAVAVTAAKGHGNNLGATIATKITDAISSASSSSH